MRSAACSRQFPDEYFLKLDEERAYPEAFVDALTKAGWMAALIPRRMAARAWGWRKPPWSWRSQPQRR